MEHHLAPSYKLDLETVRSFTDPSSKGSDFYRGTFMDVVDALGHLTRFMMAGQNLGLKVDEKFYTLHLVEGITKVKPGETVPDAIRFSEGENKKIRNLAEHFGLAPERALGILTKYFASTIKSAGGPHFYLLGQSPEPRGIMLQFDNCHILDDLED